MSRLLNISSVGLFRGVGGNLKLFQADKLLRPYPPLMYTQDAALVYFYLLSC